MTVYPIQVVHYIYQEREKLMSLKTRKKEKYVVKLYSFEKDFDILFFIDSFYKAYELRMVVYKMLMNNLKNKIFVFRMFGKTVNLVELISKDFISEWNSCKSLPAYTEKLFSLNDFSIIVETLDSFLTKNVYDFDKHCYGYAEEEYPNSLREFLKDKLALHPIVKTKEDNGEKAYSEEEIQSIVNDVCACEE
jgi:hypothetical protein